MARPHRGAAAFRRHLRVLGVSRIIEDPARQQVAVEIGDQRADVPEGEHLAPRLAALEIFRESLTPRSSNTGSRG